MITHGGKTERVRGFRKPRTQRQIGARNRRHVLHAPRNGLFRQDTSHAEAPRGDEGLFGLSHAFRAIKTEQLRIFVFKQSVPAFPFRIHPFHRGFFNGCAPDVLEKERRYPVRKTVADRRRFIEYASGLRSLADKAQFHLRKKNVLHVPGFRIRGDETAALTVDINLFQHDIADSPGALSRAARRRGDENGVPRTPPAPAELVTRRIAVRSCAPRNIAENDVLNLSAVACINRYRMGGAEYTAVLKGDIADRSKGLRPDLERGARGINLAILDPDIRTAAVKLCNFGRTLDTDPG